MFLLLTLVFYEQNTNLNHMTSSKMAAMVPRPLQLQTPNQNILDGGADSCRCQLMSNEVKLRFYMKIAGE